MILMYFSDVDHAGHDFGPDSEAVRQAVAKVDESLGRLVSGLKARGIFDQVNLILVSDHGMARVDPGNVIFLDEYFDPGQAEAVVWNGTMTSVFPKPGVEEKLYATLKAKAPAHLTVYRKQELPARFHLAESRRVGAIVVVSDEGWAMIPRESYRAPVTTAEGKSGYRGAHGFDNQLESMRALFIGRGPAFKTGTVVEPFPNIDVYNVMAKILNLTPARNDGDDATAKAVLR
jgi:predicted AlkP superfamily pyrophosphatase or phosphodiesterase